MGDYVSILLLGGAFVAAVAVLLTADPKISKRLTAAAGAMALVGGLVVYGYGYLAVAMSALEAMLRTVFAVCRMFIGEADFGDISEAPLFSHKWAVTVCWCVHVLAFYATSSAAISLIGANALKNLRVRLATRKDLNIIYGVNENSVAFGQALEEETGEILVYVAEDADSPHSETIGESNGVLRADSRAVQGNGQFLKSLGIRKGSRKVTVYALHEDYLKNVEYAKAILRAFEEKGISCQQICLVIHAREDDAVKRLQVSDGKFGYGFVTVFQEIGLAARLLIQKFPPCRSIAFDEEAAAKENFEALVIGFGQLGQVVLRNIIMNGQFAGSTFRADVFAPDVEEQDGYFRSTYQGIFDHYQVHFHSHDGRSRALYAHLQERIDAIRYIAVCTGDEGLDEAIAEELRAFVGQKGRKIPVYQCSDRGVKVTHADTLETEEHRIYHPDVLATKKLDAMAMTINKYYQGEYSKGALEDWMECDYFSRMSNRAFADFLEAVLRAAEKTEEAALAGNWEFSDAQLENLGKMEHARWNAFHFCMGFMPMSQEEYDARTAVYLEQKAQTGTGKIRIGKNLDAKTHACLIGWDDLDILSAKENAITGGKVDYKQMDKNNILLLPTLFRIRDGENG